VDFYRAGERDFKYIKYEKSLIHNTAIIAREGQNIIGVLEYEIKNIEEAEIINFDMVKSCREHLVFKGLIDEIVYWNPYLKRITYNKDNKFVADDTLMYAGFVRNDIWSLDINNAVEVFKIAIEEIIPEQLTVDGTKIDRVSPWIEKPDDVVVCCVKIGNKIVCIDGYSRLIDAYNKGFNYVFAYLETDNHNIEFYKTCMKWCEEENILRIKDLADRVVTPEEHERLWISRCQAYLKENKKS
jgi:hypothetical protein